MDWNTMKRKLKLRRRKIVDVQLPELTEAERDADRQADQSRRARLVPEATAGLDRHQVRELYRETFGHP